MKILRELREQRNLTQQFVASVIGVDRTTYAKYESGLSEPNHETTVKLADFYGVSTDVLLGVDAKREPAAPEGGGSVNTITFSRDGHIVKKQYSPERWKTIIEMLEGIPEDRLP